VAKINFGAVRSGEVEKLYCQAGNDVSVARKDFIESAKDARNRVEQ
jgi:hypothetical protein